MKRYHVKDGGWGYEADDGLWVDYDDAMAEIDALKAEVSKLCAELTDAGAKELALHNQLLSAEAELAALKAPPKGLSAEEVTEPGWYKMRYPSGYSEFVRAISGGGCSCRIITIEGQFHNLSDCRFIGPVSPSES